MHTLNGGVCRCEGLGVPGAVMPPVGVSPAEAERGQRFGNARWVPRCREVLH